MSRPSTCSTQDPNRKLSVFTECYDGDAESSSHAGSEVGDEAVFSSDNEALSSPVIQMTPKRMISSTEARFIQGSSPLPGSDSETETSTSCASVVNYTDSDYCRAQRSVRVGSVGSRQTNQNPSWTSKSVGCDSRTDSTDGVVTLLQHTEITSDEGSVTADESSNPEFDVGPPKTSIGSTHDQDHKPKKGWTKMPSDKMKSWPVTENVCFESGSGTAIEIPEEEPKLTQQEMVEKKIDLRNGFKEIVKEARKTIREVRTKRRENTKLGRSKTVSKPRNERGKGFKVIADAKEYASPFHDSTQIKNVSVGKRAQSSSGRKRLLKQRKKQEAAEIDRRQVEILITELNYLNLHEQAANLNSALVFKENQEKEYDMQLETERRKVRRRKHFEMCRQKEEAKMKRLEDMRTMEEERREKENTNRKRRVEEARERREKNRLLWESYNTVLLANSISRSFTFSYFPKLQLRPVERPQIEPEKVTRSAKVQETTEKSSRKCHK